MVKIILVFLYLYPKAVSAKNAIYYVSPCTGNDKNSGLSQTTAWRTIARVNTMQFSAGDKILFDSECSNIQGNIFFDKNDVGSAVNPITISSYGSGRATIYAGNGVGLSANNTAGFVIKNLDFSAKGSNNIHSGIQFFSSTNTDYLDYVLIENCTVSYFGATGINFITKVSKGYSNVRINHCEVFDNIKTGVYFGSKNDAYAHKNVEVNYVKAYNNKGSQVITEYSSGSGIIVSGTDKALIQYCVAYNNGELNGWKGGGPVGIWFYNTKNGIIQYCESYGNKAGKQHDGGGFDIDGGCQNCIIQYCYSHDNEGYGYALLEYGSTNTFTNNTIRYNISQNDARKNGLGAINIWAVDSNHKINDSFIYNNTFYVTKSNLAGTDIPTGIYIQNANMFHTKVVNNIFYLSDSLPFAKSFGEPITTSQLLVLNNCYYNSNGSYNFNWGNNYSSFLSWRSGSFQEQYAGVQYGKTVDPQLTSVGNAGTVGFNGNLTALNNYKLLPKSSIINSGLNLNAVFGISVGDRDFYGNNLSKVDSFSIGAHQTIK